MRRWIGWAVLFLGLLMMCAALAIILLAPERVTTITPAGATTATNFVAVAALLIALLAALTLGVIFALVGRWREDARDWEKRKRKREEIADEKPKRRPEYIIGAHGELVEVFEEHEQRR